MSAMHVDHYGWGAPLLFIHGWGMHGGMWGGVLEKLAEHFQVMAVDLPGHGLSGKREEGRGKGALFGAAVFPFTLDTLVDQLSSQFPGPLAVCGWSLGGQLALRWAQRYPAQVDRLILVSSTPCFVQRVDWCCAMAAETLADFSAALQQDYASTLRRFLALQVRGSEQERELLLALRQSLRSRGEPDPAALQAGLAILNDTDLRAALSEIAQPTLLIAGERDALTPPAASQYMAEQMHSGRLATIAGAAHAPFLSHTEEFVKHVVDFLHE
jgi:pimeloyl-[acyl-carrier protein] methyl ester esterase